MTEGYRRRDRAVPAGRTTVLDSSNAPLSDLCVERLRLADGSPEFSATTENRETVLHILVGRCDIEVSWSSGKTRVFQNLGERRDVFSGLPTTLVLGPSMSWTVRPARGALDIAIASVPSPTPGLADPVAIRPQDVRVHDIGEEHYSRMVREVIGGDGPALRLRVGETINPTGKWSSWPHHDFHANPDLAPKFEEVFLYFTKPGSGWALQKRDGLFANLAPVDDVFVVRNGDASVMPLGDHPVVAGVDSQLLYMWFYVSPIPKIYAKWAEDLGGYA
jgi:5-deoxy-glucuronate isomerase